MKTIYVVMLVVAFVIFLATIISMFFKKTRKPIVIIPSILIILCLLGYVGYSYFSEVPTINLNGMQSIILQANEQYEELGVTAKYHEKNVEENVEITGNVDTTKPGTYTIKYTYTYLKSKKVELYRTIIVEDKEAPTITLKGEKEITLYVDESYKEPGYTATDNVDKELSDKVTVEKKEINNKKYEMVYTVKDSSGNEATVARTINLKERPKKTTTTNNTSSKGTTANNSSKPATTNNGSKGTNSTSGSKGNNSSTGASTGSSNKGTTTSSNSNSSAPNSGIIYLTFDDGPSLDITPKILNILKEENVKATFFILNYDSNKEKLVKREANEGHSIGIHGYSHVYKDIYKSEEAYMENITKLQTKIKATTGITTTITRFPGGSSNTVSRFNPKIMTRLTKLVVDKGFKYYDWNVSSGDAGGAKNKDKVYNNVTKNLKRNRSNIVLMHDFSGNNKTLDALRAIIQFGRQNGYTFKPITKDTPMITHGVNN